MYSNWAQIDGLPPVGEPYGTRQAISYNLTQNAWQAVTLRTEGQAQVACMSMGPSFTTTNAPVPEKSNKQFVIIFVSIFVPIAVAIIVATVIACLIVFKCIPAGCLPCCHHQRAY